MLIVGLSVLLKSSDLPGIAVGLSHEPGRWRPTYESPKTAPKGHSSETPHKTCRILRLRIVTYYSACLPSPRASCWALTYVARQIAHMRAHGAGESISVSKQKGTSSVVLS